MELKPCPFCGAEVIPAWNMRVYIVTLDNCEMYEDFYKWTHGVYATEEAALDAVRSMGFDMETKMRKIPYTEDGKPYDKWEEYGMYDAEAFDINEWEVQR